MLEELLKRIFSVTLWYMWFITYSLFGWAPELVTLLLLSPPVVFVAFILFVIYAITLPIQGVVQFYSFLNTYLRLRFSSKRLPDVRVTYWDKTKPLKSFFLSLIWHAPRARGHSRACVLFMSKDKKGNLLQAAPLLFFHLLFRLVLGAPSRVLWQVTVGCRFWMFPRESVDDRFTNFAKELSDALILDAAGVIKYYN